MWLNYCFGKVMKNLIIPILCFALFGCNEPEKKQHTVTKDSSSSASEAEVKPKITTTNPIEFIKQKVNLINTSNLQKKHFEFTCDELTKVDYYYNGDQLVKIAIDFGTVGDAYAKEDYYYDDGKLIFKYEFVEGGPACEGCITTNEYRSYIVNNKVIKYLKNKDVAACRKCEFSANSKELLLIKANDVAGIEAVLCS